MAETPTTTTLKKYMSAVKRVTIDSTSQSFHSSCSILPSMPPILEQKSHNKIELNYIAGFTGYECRLHYMS